MICPPMASPGLNCPSPDVPPAPASCGAPAGGIPPCKNFYKEHLLRKQPARARTLEAAGKEASGCAWGATWPPKTLRPRLHGAGCTSTWGWMPHRDMPSACGVHGSNPQPSCPPAPKAACPAPPASCIHLINQVPPLTAQCRPACILWASLPSKAENASPLVKPLTGAI